MDPPTVPARIAYWATRGTGLREAQYPVTATYATPALLVVWADAEIQHTSEQYWLMTLEGVLVAQRAGNTVVDVRAADALIAPLVDRFRATQGNEAHHLTHPTEDGHVDFCRVVRARPMWFGEGESAEYGALFTFSVKLRRIPAAVN
jgi:hypothetical protein